MFSSSKTTIFDFIKKTKERQIRDEVSSLRSCPLFPSSLGLKGEGSRGGRGTNSEEEKQRKPKTNLRLAAKRLLANCYHLNKET